MRLEGAVGSRGAVGFGDHAKVALMFQHAPVALPDDRMIVDQQDRDSLLLCDAHIANSVMRRSGSSRPRLGRAWRGRSTTTRRGRSRARASPSVRSPWIA